MAGGYPAAVSFTLTGTPSGATATFSPATIAAGSGAQTVTLTIQTPVHTAALNDDQPMHKPAPWAFSLLIFPLAMLGRLKGASRRVRQWGTGLSLLILGIALSTGLSGCASNNNSSTQTVNNYGLVVTATSGGVQHNNSIVLTVK